MDGWVIEEEDSFELWDGRYRRGGGTEVFVGGAEGLASVWWILSWGWGWGSDVVAVAGDQKGVEG